MKEYFVNLPEFDIDFPFRIMLAGISYCDSSYYIKRLKSDVLCFEYIIKGSGTVKTQGETYHPKAGDSYMLMPNEFHEYYPDEKDPWVKMWFNASGYLAETLPDAYNLHKKTLFHADTEKYIKAIHTALKDSSLSPREISNRTAQIFLQLMQYLNKIVLSDSVSSDAKKMKNFIDTNTNRIIAMSELSSLIYKSPAQAIRIFKKNYGTTPYEYHIENKIKRAIILLTNSDLSIKDISYMLGFSDQHYFSSLFKKKTGKSPSDFK